MTTLYRSPNVIVDRHEWHLVVRRKGGRTFKRFYWRPLSDKSLPWLNIVQWKGPKPKRLSHYFEKFDRHVKAALLSESRRKEALANLRGPVTAAQAVNMAA